MRLWILLSFISYSVIGAVGGRPESIDVFRHVHLEKIACKRQGPGTLTFSVPSQAGSPFTVEAPDDLCLQIRGSQQVPIEFFVRGTSLFGVAFGNEALTELNRGKIQITHQR